MADAELNDYDEWFRGQVQASLDDPRPSITAEAARQHMAAQREKLRRLIEAGEANITAEPEGDS